jgi:hypothetical protein
LLAMFSVVPLRVHLVAQLAVVMQLRAQLLGFNFACQLFVEVASHFKPFGRNG